MLTQQHPNRNHTDEGVLPKTNRLHPKLKQLAKQITFHPNTGRQILLDWINSIAIDWPISRRPCTPRRFQFGTVRAAAHHSFLLPVNITGRGEINHPPQYVPNAVTLGLRVKLRTFDTWMDSSISALYISKYQADPKFFKRAYPVSIRPQGKDIVRTWLHYSVLRCYQLTGRAPFTDAWINGLGMDEQGQAMHKSKGNVVEPEPVLERFGADSFRFWKLPKPPLGSDFRCSETRIASAHKTMTKLWNLSRFISSFPRSRLPHSSPATNGSSPSSLS